MVEQQVKNDSITHYTLNSKSEATVFFVTRRIGLTYNIVYKHNRLISSYSKSTRNEVVEITTIKWENNSYLLNRVDGSFCIKPVVDCSTVKLFFAEPCNAGQVLSERMGEFRSLVKTGEGVYKADMQDGLTYFYRYKNGILTELEMRKGMLGSVYLRLRP